ncbi:MAG: hypothetical protein A3G34_02035 [Candidatus Lindowbacteria bacterium RIFCSPLOWO2_12_FULL_62_27]|nr:MAG: hypothetical protein A3I06_11555 [Candidatus Lindowbacteria bacterium RIFCSPLOWO2_02_FULL_62_12]OGH59086.1 MAG: hypothetical protein A3G34_02035 [Candidatus Lindowbacteria bacterium RIFCSPLOWO2_12_FULL_62_27]
MGPILRVYIDTSVVSGCLEEKWQEDSLKLMELFASGKMRPVLSNLTIDEVLAAPSAEVRALLERPELKTAEKVKFDDEADGLAEAYIQEGVVTRNSLTDAQHIAAATVFRANVLVSWNFRHIVNLRRIQMFNAANLKRGYPMLDIRSPKEVLGYGDVEGF